MKYDSDSRSELLPGFWSKLSESDCIESLNSSRKFLLCCRQFYLASLQVDRRPGVKLDFPAIHVLGMDESFEHVYQSSRRSYTSCCKMGKTISSKCHDGGNALEYLVSAEAEEALSCRWCRVFEPFNLPSNQTLPCWVFKRFDFSSNKALTGTYTPVGKADFQYEFDVIHLQPNTNTNTNWTKHNQAASDAKFYTTEHSRVLREHSRMLFRSREGFQRQIQH